MTNLAVPLSTPRMGRPPLNMTAMTLRLPKDTSDRIDALVGNKRRAQFIREAVEKELASREGDGPPATESSD